MEQRYVQDRSKWDFIATLRLKPEPVSPWGGDDKLLGAEERTEVFIKVLLLLPGAAVRSGPQVHWVGGEAHVPQTHAAHHHQHDAHRDHQNRTAHTERPPAAEDATEEILKALT